MASFCKINSSGISRKPSKSSGRKSGSCTSAVAYITGQKIYDERLNQTFDYGNKERISSYETILPEGAPEEFKNLEVLWNDVELNEKNDNARTGIRQMIAFDYNIPEEDREQAVRDYAKKTFTDKGIPVTIAWHIKDDDTNPHAHIIAANRRIDPETGKWQTKRKTRYALDEEGNKKAVYETMKDEKGNTLKDEKGDPILKLDENGQPIQKLGARNTKIWEREYIERNPLDAKDFVKTCRETWAECANKYIKEPEKHIDPRSYKEQGIDQEPLKNYSRIAWYNEKNIQEKEERTGIPQRHTDIYYKNIAIKEGNQSRRELSAIEKKAKNFLSNINFLKDIKSLLTPAISDLVKNIGGFLRHEERDIDRAKDAVRDLLGEDADFVNLRHVFLGREETEDGNVYQIEADLRDNSLTVYDEAYALNHEDEPPENINIPEIEGIMITYAADDEHDYPIANFKYRNIDELLTTGVFRGTKETERTVGEYIQADLDSIRSSLNKTNEKQRKAPSQNKKPKRSDPSL